MSERVVGLMVGRENTFPQPFLDVVNSKGAAVGVRAEMAVLGGAAVPKTVVLPNKEYVPDIDPQVSLRNLQFPLDWEAIVGYTGLPAVLKPNTGGGWKDVHVVGSIEELIRAYDTSGQKTMILQEFIDWQDYV